MKSGTAKSTPALLEGGTSDTLNLSNAASGGAPYGLPSTFLHRIRFLNNYLRKWLPWLTQSRDLDSAKIALTFKC